MKTKHYELTPEELRYCMEQEADTHAAIEESRGGLELARLLGLKRDKITKRFATSQGNKTALGLYRTISDIMADTRMSKARVA